MSQSPSPLYFSSSASSPSPAPISLYKRFKAILAPFRNAAIGYVEGLQLATNRVVSSTTPRDMEDLKLDDLYWKTENDASFHAVSYKKKQSSDEKTWNADLDDDLRLPAFFTSNCSKVVYCLLPQVREVLGDDPEFDKAFWSRAYIDPALILFDVDENGYQYRSPLPFFAHDFITIKSKDNQRFVLDVTGDQFGLEEWFYTKRDYGQLLLDGQTPEITGEATKIYEVETEDTRNSILKLAVEQALEDVKVDWAREFISWKDLFLLPEWKQSQLREGVAAKVRARVVAALSG